MNEIWTAVLRRVRESKNPVLFSLITNIDDIVFTAFNIILRTNSEAEFAILTQNLSLLKEYAGGDYITVQFSKTQTQSDDRIFARLRELFGGKLQ